MRKILVLSAAFLLGISLHSCGSDDKLPIPGIDDLNDVTQEYKTTYHIALSNGKVFDGISTNDFGQLCQNDEDEKFIPINVYGIDTENNNFIASIIILGDELLPLGSDRKNFSENSIIALNYGDPSIHYTSVPQDLSSPVIGNHSISNLQIHNYITSSSGIDKATFRYEFNDVVLYETVTGAELTASGYIECVVN